MTDSGIDVFERTSIKFSPAGGTRVEWELSRLISDPGPYYFTLQGAKSSADTADFINIGPPAINTWFLIDDESRVYGKDLDWCYRVKLTTALRTYYSTTITADSGVDYRTWRIVRELIRKEKLRLSKYAGLETAVIFKRKITAQRCPRCADPLTDEAIDGNCPVCFGTSLLNGYYSAVPIFIELPVATEAQKIDIESTGTKTQSTVQNCRVVGDVVVAATDVIWDKGSGRRYIVHEYTELATMRGYNIVAAVNLRMAPFTDVVYTIPEEGL